MVIVLPQAPMGASTVCVCVCVTHVWWVVPVSQVFDGAVIVLSLAPMVASTVANGPSSPWDAIGLIITLRIWRAKRIIDGEAPGGGGGGGRRAAGRAVNKDMVTFASGLSAAANHFSKNDRVILIRVS